MGAYGPRGRVALEEQNVWLHQEEHPLDIQCGPAHHAPRFVQDRLHTPIAEGRPHVLDGTEGDQDGIVVGTALGTVRPRLAPYLLDEIGASHAEHFGHGLHREETVGGDGSDHAARAAASAIKLYSARWPRDPLMSSGRWPTSTS